MSRSDTSQSRNQPPVVTEAGPGGVHRVDPGNTSSTPASTSTAGARTVTLAVVGAVAAMIVVVAAVQNSASVELEFLWWAVDAPLAVLLVAALIIGGLLTSVVASISRHRRRSARAGRASRGIS